LPLLEAEGIELVSIRELVTIAAGTRPLATSAE
jgi:hypothetical protein